MTPPRGSVVYLDGARYEPPEDWSIVRARPGVYGWIDLTRGLEGWGQAARSRRVTGRVEVVHADGTVAT